MQIENLEIGDGGIAGVHLMALGQQGFCKIVGPACFGAFHLDERGLQQLSGRVWASPRLMVSAMSTRSLVDLFFIARIAAQKIIIEIQAVQHDLVAHGFNGANAFERRGGVETRRALAQSSEDIDDEQADQDRPAPRRNPTYNFLPIFIAKRLHSLASQPY